MRIFIVIVVLSAITLIPDVRNAISKAIARTRESIFSSLYQKSRISNKSLQRQRLNIGSPSTTPHQEGRPLSAGNLRPAASSVAVDVSEELRQNRWTTTKQIFY